MDIPGSPPKGSSKPASVSAGEPAQTTQTAAAPRPVALEQLNLVKGQPYTAVVLGKAEGFSANGRNDGTASNQYLVQVGSQTILVTSDKPLDVKQQLLVTLFNTQPAQLRVLPTATPMATAPQTPDAAPANARPSPRLSGEQVNTLLRALTPIMAKQSSLQQALQQLQAWQKSTPTGESRQPLLALTRALLETQALSVSQLARSTENAPGVKTGTAPPTTPSASGPQLPPNAQDVATFRPLAADSGQQILRTLLQSGLFLEQQLKQTLTATSTETDTHTPHQGDTAARRDTQTLQGALRTLLAGDNLPKDPALRTSLERALTQLDTKPPSANTTAASASQGSATQASGEPQTSALRTLQNWLLGLRPPGATTETPPLSAADASPSARANAAAQVLNSNLKGALVQAISLLHSIEPTDQSDKKLHPLTQLDLLKTPFDFPHPAQQSVAKASALLSEEPLSTGQMLRLLASVLNRLQFNQLNSLYQSHNNSSDTQIQQSWFFELPLLNEQQQMQALHLRIDKKHDAEKQQQEDAHKHAIQWQLTLSFDLDQLGPLYVQVKLTPPSISSVVWADHAATLALIERERAQLRERLEQLGLEVGDIHCQRGRPQQDATKLAHQLVDIKA